MQAFISDTIIMIVLTALFVQMVWMTIARRARDRYLRDMANFRKPESPFSRYYGWRVDSLRNSILDGVAVEVILIVSLLLLLFLSLEPFEIPSVFPVVIFVIVLSSMSTAQTAYRVKGLKFRETLISKELELSVDKVAAARNMAINLLSAGKAADGRVWFALYRVGQRQDPIGWSVRDVLLDEELKFMYQGMPIGEGPKTDEASSSDGPGIN
ncbi:MAG: hypothetical protein ACFFD3_09015 [Candidatus Thorarchaeota archaeon]